MLVNEQFSYRNVFKPIKTFFFFQKGKHLHCFGFYCIHTVLCNYNVALFLILKVCPQMQSD